MPKKKKKENHMIDISGRINIKVVAATAEEIEHFEHELRDIEMSVEKRMKQYEEEINRMMIEATSADIITVTEEDALYFIETYEKIFVDRNSQNIINRLKQYLLCIKEQES